MNISKQYKYLYQLSSFYEFTKSSPAFPEVRLQIKHRSSETFLKENKSENIT